MEKLYKRKRPATEQKQRFFYTKTCNYLIRLLDGRMNGEFDDADIEHLHSLHMDFVIGEFQRNYINDKTFEMCIGAMSAFEGDWGSIKDGKFPPPNPNHPDNK